MERILQSHAAAACNPSCPQQRSPTAYKAKVISEINERLRGRWHTLRVKTTGSIHSMSAFSASSAGSVSSAIVSPTQVSPPPESEWVPTPATPSSVLSQLTVELFSCKILDSSTHFRRWFWHLHDVYVCLPTTIVQKSRMPRTPAANHTICPPRDPAAELRPLDGVVQRFLHCSSD